MTRRASPGATWKLRRPAGVRIASVADVSSASRCATKLMRPATRGGQTWSEPDGPEPAVAVVAARVVAEPRRAVRPPERVRLRRGDALRAAELRSPRRRRRPAAAAGAARRRASERAVARDAQLVRRRSASSGGASGSSTIRFTDRFQNSCSSPSFGTPRPTPARRRALPCGRPTSGRPAGSRAGRRRRSGGRTRRPRARRPPARRWRGRRWRRWRIVSVRQRRGHRERAGRRAEGERAAPDAAEQLLGARHREQDGRVLLAAQRSRSPTAAPSLRARTSPRRAVRRRATTATHAPRAGRTPTASSGTQ